MTGEREAVLSAHPQASLGASVAAAWQSGLPGSLLLSWEPGPPPSSITEPDWPPGGEAITRICAQGGKGDGWVTQGSREAARAQAPDSTIPGLRRAGSGIWNRNIL